MKSFSRLALAALLLAGSALRASAASVPSPSEFLGFEVGADRKLADYRQIWIRGEDRLTRRAAAVAMTYGKGKIVLLGFRPQHRAQTNVTYPFVFNSLYWSTARP